MGGGVPIDRQPQDPSAQSLGGAHRGRVCVHTSIGMSVCMCL